MSTYASGLEHFKKHQAEFSDEKKLIVKFNYLKKEFLGGTDKQVVQLGSSFAIDFLQMSCGYLKFDGNKLVEKRMVAIGSPGQVPTREELGDTDQSKWEIGSDRLRDPWQPTWEIPGVEVDGEKRQVIFTGSSKGAEIAWRKLYNAILRQVDQNPGKLPVVRLAAGEFKGKFGPVAMAEFVITGWVANGTGNGLADDDDDFAEDDPHSYIPF
jgi:hypothetical protein